ncbi:MAG: amino acid adenylation domain-containing protein, partial [bacterium]|nr:amino acid adenylation domain-containing protein [bacterium]
LARGYLDRPALTAERFAPAFSGARLYRTGDLARTLSDGTIEFLGRIDHQVKIRGFRVELGEIEAVLSRSDLVRECVVLAREEASGAGPMRPARLVAYAVTDPGTEPRELRARLQESLPDYMVPSAFVRLETLPRLPNGKVDREALPAPARPGPEVDLAAPADPAEELLAGIWAGVLDLDRIGAHENFFELGGHSLLATQVVSRIREAFGVELPLPRLFEAPTVAELAAVVRALRQEQEGIAVLPMVPVPRGRTLPLSFAQQRLWFLDQLEPASPVYNIPLAVRLRGALPVPLLERIFSEVMRRHEVLRTTFEPAAGEPRQVITAELELALPVVDLQALPEAVREAEVGRLAAAEARLPFDLAVGPLVRVTLVRLTADDQAVLVTMHHIASDGWSMGVFRRELAVLAEAFAQGRPSPLPELPVQYADFAHWQRQWLRGEVLEAQLAYWRVELAGIPARLELPTDRPRPAVPSYRGRHLGVALPEELSRALAALARRQGVTSFMTLLAAFQTLLGRWAGTDDVAVGTPIAGRNRRQIEDLIGFFVNTLVLRTDLRDDSSLDGPAFQELLTRVRRVALDAYAHQDLPFEQLVEEVQPERDLSSTPLFQVMFVRQNAPQVTVEMPALAISSLPADVGTTKFDLTLSLQESERGIRGSLAYRTDLFDPTTMARLGAQFSRLLTAIADDPERRLGELPLVSAAERHQLLTAWNDTLHPDPRGLLVHELFEAQVEKRPEAVAVGRPPREALSYRELNRRANRLGARLRELGVGGPASRPDEVVGICLERSAELIAGLLAILKAGGAYLPLDPEDPPERLAYLLEDSGVSVVLAEERTAAALPAAAPAGIEVLSDWDFAAPGEAPNPVSGVTAGHRAYLIYTSGSTGRPKGVMVEHRSLVDFLGWVDRELFGPRTVPLVNSISFDASLKQLFAPLLRGAAVVVLGKDTVSEPAALVAALDASGLQALNCVPSLWAALLGAMESGEAAVPPSLRHLWLGGEELREDLVRRTRTLLPEIEIGNLYGPTEATSLVSWAPRLGAGRPPIGRPLANTRLHVLDAALRPVPIGVVGELAIGGPGVARGYLRRPELTATRFVPDPHFGNPAGGRLYRTGDLVRALGDGRLEFLGRRDHQIQLRGFRIELGEIESVLSGHESVRECAVVARGEDSGDPLSARLVAYVAAGDPAPDARELRAFLRRTLPDHMVPSAFVVLEALPLLTSGKVNRGALPEPEVGGVAEAFAAPGDPSEELIAEIWAAVLGLNRVGTHDNFFELGGHSLLATQIVSRARETFAVELPLPRLFEAPTVAELAAVVRALRDEQRGLVAPPMVPIPRDQGLPRD